MAIASAYGKNQVAAAYGTIGAYGAIYTTTPGATAGTEPTGGSPAYARKPLTWVAGADGVVAASATFDVPPGTTIMGTGVHTAVTGGNYVDGKSEASVTFPVQDTVTVNFTYTQV